MDNLEKPNSAQSSFFQEWLEKLQQESWQLELLISGFALFGIWEAKTTIDQLDAYFDVNASGGSVYAAIGLLILTLKGGWIIFFFNLLIHIILRGLWIGAIGLRYVSNDIDYDRLNYSEWMTDYLRRKVGNYDNYIERLERLCSVIFAYTFLLFFLFLSVMIFIAEVAIISVLTTKYASDQSSLPFIFGQMALLIFVVLGLVIAIDVITLGFFRRVKDKSFSKVYGYIYRFYAYATLSFTYRALLYNFLDDKYTRKLFLFSIPYILILILIAPNIYSNAHRFFPDLSESDDLTNHALELHTIQYNFYDDQRVLHGAAATSAKEIRTASLRSYEHKGPLMPIFLAIRPTDDAYLEQKIGLSPLYKEGLRLNFLNNATDLGELEDLKQKRENLIGEILEDKKTKRKELRDQGLYKDEVKRNLMVTYDIKLDSVNAIYDSILIANQERSTQRAIEEVVELFDMNIDGIKVSPIMGMTRYYRHPNIGEKGLLTYLPLDSLTVGGHVLEIERTYYSENIDQLLERQYSVRIPFVKIHD